MNFSAVLEALNSASAFELYRLRVAINRKLDDPKWIEAIRWRLRVGHQQWRTAYQFLHHVHDSIPGTVVDLPGQATFLPAAKS